MKNIINQRHWLYLLTALLLFMQSFAVWHDVSHPYHLASEQCERLASISHTPSLDTITSIPLPFISDSCSVEALFSVAFVSTKLRNNHSIRAPLFFHSSHPKKPTV
ncbi:MAG: hypothetical protein HRT93_02040 [Piscirickettsiaceae bacterium]|nr:hypothetical protein [Piscirickettsiaceae bacterium]